jgi:Lrp/AsnC family transcriptional regulator, leucine-responsive regulatory protein
MEGLLDEIGWRILHELQEDARLSYSELGRRINLSAPAVAERVKRMEEAGIITGYHVALDPFKFGATLMVSIRMSTTGGNYDRATETIKQMDEIVECHRLTGSDCFSMIAIVTSIAHLEQVIKQLMPFGTVNSSIVLSSPVQRRTFNGPLPDPVEE